ncbi:Zinc finger protein 271 [Nymphon striatum]|nr:Zinc finger protein 271 [Nymphon striatum]
MDSSEWCKITIKKESGMEIEHDDRKAGSAPDWLTLEVKTIKKEKEDSPRCVFEYYDDSTSGIKYEERDIECDQKTSEDIIDLKRTKQHLTNMNKTSITTESSVRMHKTKLRDKKLWECKMDLEDWSRITIKTEPEVKIVPNSTKSDPALTWLNVEIKKVEVEGDFQSHVFDSNAQEIKHEELYDVKEENEESQSSVFDECDSNVQDIKPEELYEDFMRGTCEDIVGVTNLKRIDQVYDARENLSASEWSFKTLMCKPIKEKRLVCNICNKTFTQNESFEIHKSKHANKTPFECTACNKNFTEKSSLTKHMREHSNEDLIECSICKKCFIQSDDLKYHVLIHTDEKPFGCDVCHKTFGRKADLKNHLKIHIKDKTFGRKADLKNHLNIHTKDKPFECNIGYIPFENFNNLS